LHLKNEETEKKDNISVGIIVDIRVDNNALSLAPSSASCCPYSHLR
jgi:hypothetical protein